MPQKSGICALSVHSNSSMIFLTTSFMEVNEGVSLEKGLNLEGRRLFCVLILLIFTYNVYVYLSNNY